MNRKPPPSGLERAHWEVNNAAKWARQVGMNNVAPRLEFAARIIREEINKQCASGPSNVEIKHDL
jgi:hypothetical protein